MGKKSVAAALPTVGTSSDSCMGNGLGGEEKKPQREGEKFVAAAMKRGRKKRLGRDQPTRSKRKRFLSQTIPTTVLFLLRLPKANTPTVVVLFERERKESSRGGGRLERRKKKGCRKKARQ